MAFIVAMQEWNSLFFYAAHPRWGVPETPFLQFFVQVLSLGFWPGLLGTIYKTFVNIVQVRTSVQRLIDIDTKRK